LGSRQFDENINLICHTIMSNKDNVIEEIKDRISNPIIFAFLLSWLIWNWEIPIGLLWYNSDTIINTGSPDILSYIKDRVDFRRMVCSPLISAVFYVVAVPWVKNIAIWWFENARIMGSQVNKFIEAYRDSDRKPFKDHSLLYGEWEYKTYPLKGSKVDMNKELDSGTVNISNNNWQIWSDHKNKNNQLRTIQEYVFLASRNTGFVSLYHTESNSQTTYIDITEIFLFRRIKRDSFVFYSHDQAVQLTRVKRK
jgi:hypothetical protein